MTVSFTAVPGNSAAQTKQGVCAISCGLHNSRAASPPDISEITGFPVNEFCQLINIFYLTVLRQLIKSYNVHFMIKAPSPEYQSSKWKEVCWWHNQWINFITGVI